MAIEQAPRGCEISISDDAEHQDFISKKDRNSTGPARLPIGIAPLDDGPPRLILGPLP
jgi:hypothetical protein